MKKAISLVLTIALALGMCTTAFAAGDATTTNDGKNNSEVNLLGKAELNAKLISVVMPTSINFQIATKDDSGTNVFDRLVTGDGTVTNNSNCDVKLSVVEVKDSNNLLTPVDLALAPKGKTLVEAMAAYKLTAGTTSIELGTIAEAGTLVLNIFGQDNAADTSSLTDGNYTVSTIIKVEAATV